MKKYDLILSGIYVAVLVLIMSVVLDITKQEQQVKTEVKNEIENLYKQTVKTLVIQDTPLHLTLKRDALPREIQSGFILSGSMFVRNADFFQVRGDTLLVTGEIQPVSILTLHLDPSVKLDTIINAPNVKR